MRFKLPGLILWCLKGKLYNWWFEEPHQILRSTCIHVNTSHFNLYSIFIEVFWDNFLKLFLSVKWFYLNKLISRQARTCVWVLLSYNTLFSFFITHTHTFDFFLSLFYTHTQTHTQTHTHTHTNTNFDFYLSFSYTHTHAHSKHTKHTHFDFFLSLYLFQTHRHRVAKKSVYLIDEWSSGHNNKQVLPRRSISLTL